MDRLIDGWMDVCVDEYSRCVDGQIYRLIDRGIGTDIGINISVSTSISISIQ